MKALVHDGHGNIALLDRPHPRLVEPTDAIVRVTRSTICTSDLHIMRGAVPRAKPDTVLGHEFVGVVEEVGSGVRSFSPGDRVAVNCETFCGECFFCRRGWVNNCERGGWLLGCTIDGCQAEYVRVPYADNAFTRIPDGVSDEDALFLGDILATGWWGARLAEIEPGSTVAVIGAGPVGLTTMMCARLANPAQVIALDVDERRLGLARGHGLADVVINPAEKSLDEVESLVRAATGGRGADAVRAMPSGETIFFSGRLAPAGIASVSGYSLVLPCCRHHFSQPIMQPRISRSVLAESFLLAYARSITSCRSPSVRRLIRIKPITGRMYNRMKLQYWEA